MYHTALARSHRPRSFVEIVGQDHVGSTLRAAIVGDRVGHAYLFCGPRGVGKTTAARILAMALNCSNREAGEPCGRCDSCTRIWSGQASFDVVEIDAASHRGVDDARDLRERAMYAPTTEERYKVYILDEAHMLTRDAWNALLKILEEPPPRVIFAFATTEPQKIERGAAPVLSRCQRFDFRRVSVRDIVSRLEHVLGLEKVTAEPEALLAIARRADGGVRDALSLLDQVLSFSGDHVGAADVQRMLGLVDEDRYLELFRILAERERAAVFGFVQSLLDAGLDPGEFVRGLADAIRIMLVLGSDPSGETLEITNESREAFTAAAGPFSDEQLLRFLVAVGDFEISGRLQRGSQPRIQLEVLLLRLASMDSTVGIDELLQAAGGRPPPATRPQKPSRETRSPDDASLASSGAPGAPSGRSGAGVPAATPPVSHEREPEALEASPAAASAASGPDATADDLTALRETWVRALASLRGTGGQIVALRGARVEALHATTIHLKVPEGLGADVRGYLDNRERSAAVRERLASELGIEADRLTFVVGDASSSRRRLTADDARQRRLSDMMDVDPRLKEAVEELDLTLKE